MKKELAAMDALGMFERCFISLGSNLITCKWSFVTKWNADVSEPSLFFNGAGDDFIAISVHVHDQTIIARSLPSVISPKLAMANRLGIDGLGETTYTLGLEVQRDSASGRLLLSQRKFIVTILERFSKYVPPP